MIPKYATWLWVVLGKNLQKEYDQIKAWKLDPQTAALLDVIWKNISPSLQAALWAFIKQIYEKYGEETAKKILSQNVSLLAKEL